MSAKETLCDLHLRWFRGDRTIADDLLRAKRLRPREWLESRFSDVERLGRAVEDAVRSGIDKVGPDELLMLAYFDLARAVGRVHTHHNGDCDTLACSARIEALTYTRFRRQERERLEELLFPGLSRAWLRDMVILAAHQYFPPQTLPAKLEDWRKRQPAVDARAWVWGLVDDVLTEDSRRHAMALAARYKVRAGEQPHVKAAAA